ncbi:hypothetical protein [Segatella paludivivens]|uniref:hypothetical protein n=1 Tax=Segatella paludivivens TaxID=185294 RepID=UPI000471712A|nr:hypothetical protein [Segatella paludivivens]
MKKVSKISCINLAGFVLKFKVVWNGGESGWSALCPISQTESFDLHTLNIPDGAEVWIEVQALDQKKAADEHVLYDPTSGDTAIYETRKSPSGFEIKLIN